MISVLMDSLTSHQKTMMVVNLATVIQMVSIEYETNNACHKLDLISNSKKLTMIVDTYLPTRFHPKFILLLYFTYKLSTYIITNDIIYIMLLIIIDN